MSYPVICHILSYVISCHMLYTVICHMSYCHMLYPVICHILSFVILHLCIILNVTCDMWHITCHVSCHMSSDNNDDDDDGNYDYVDGDSDQLNWDLSACGAIHLQLLSVTSSALKFKIKNECKFQMIFHLSGCKFQIQRNQTGKKKNQMIFHLSGCKLKMSTNNNNNNKKRKEKIYFHLSGCQRRRQLCQGVASHHLQKIPDKLDIW